MDQTSGAALYAQDLLKVAYSLVFTCTASVIFFKLGCTRNEAGHDRQTQEQNGCLQVRGFRLGEEQSFIFLRTGTTKFAFAEQVCKIQLL